MAVVGEVTALAHVDRDGVLAGVEQLPAKVIRLSEKHP